MSYKGWPQRRRRRKVRTEQKEGEQKPNLWEVADERMWHLDRRKGKGHILLQIHLAIWQHLGHNPTQHILYTLLYIHHCKLYTFPPPLPSSVRKNTGFFCVGTSIHPIHSLYLCVNSQCPSFIRAFFLHDVSFSSLLHFLPIKIDSTFCTKMEK
jgi:hypothetical protein